MRTIQAVPITLDKPRRLLLDFRALAKAEQALAKFWGEKRFSLIKVFQSEEVGVAEITHVIWAGLLHEEPALTYDGVMTLLATANLDEVCVVVADAIKTQLGGRGPEAGSVMDPQKPGTLPSGTGSDSGLPPGTTSASPM